MSLHEVHEGRAVPTPEYGRGRARRRAVVASACALGIAACAVPADTLSSGSVDAAAYADSVYAGAAIATLADLLAFETVHVEGLDNAVNPAFRAMTEYLGRTAAELGLDFTDHGNVVVIGLGAARDRLGLVAHGDVVPADPAKWAQDPFSLDTLSEPGRIVGRGSIDDKGAIASALYALKAVKDQALPLRRRVELIISYTEESDWAPFMAFLRENPPPELNIGFDSEYPVVVAEKGWNTLHLGVPPTNRAAPQGAYLVSLAGGVFLSQIPEDAEAVIARPTPRLEQVLRGAAARDSLARYEFISEGARLRVRARGRSAHSSKPEAGVNAITHLAALLGSYDFPDTPAARMVRLINDLVGLGDHGELFGEVALTDPFMGPLTLSLTTLGLEGDTLVAGISIRSPVGRSKEVLERLLRRAVDAWTERTDIAVGVRIFTSDPYYLDDAPHIPVLLRVFERFTGQPDPQPVSIGGGTHARLLPNGVDFGPAMPGEPYPGHSEHEFITRDEFRLNLMMYTALIVELAAQ